MRKTIGIIGFGNMGSAIAERIESKYRVTVFDKDKNKTKNLSGINVVLDNIDLVKKVDTVILAVKPQDFDELLDEIKEASKGKLIISIAAGVATDRIEKALGDVRVIRVMPNLPALIGKGISYLCSGRSAKRGDLKFALRLFNNLGATFITSEDMMHSVTAASGSGPGFWCSSVENIPKNQWAEYTERDFIPKFSTAVEFLGFKKKEARRVSKLVGWGTLVTVQSWHTSPSQLKKQVASKGGTTEAGLAKLESGGSFEDALLAAKRRSEELSKKE